MKEGLPIYEPVPNELEVRRDALLLRIVEMREAIQNTDFDQQLVSKELSELDARVQQVEGSRDMELFEEIFNTLEKIVDSKLKKY